MKKRVLSTLCSFFILCGIVLNMSVNTNAQGENSSIVDGSVLTQDEYSKGSSANQMLRGEHLMEGECCVSKAGVGRIYVYGQTTADHVVDYVAVLMDVEQLVEIDGEEAWIQIKFYDADARDTYYVNVDDTLKVERGYYYRVHCDHIAGNEDDRPYDTSVSATNGIWIP